MLKPLTFGKPNLRVLLCLCVLTLGALPVRGTPPEGATEPAGIVEGTRPRATNPGRTRSRWPNLTGLSRWLGPALLGWLAGSNPAILVEAVPALPLQPTLFALPAFNLSTTDPVSVLAADGVSRALLQANLTGGLPPMEDLNVLLAASSPQGLSTLATLPWPPASGSMAAPGLPTERVDELVPFPSEVLPARASGTGPGRGSGNGNGGLVATDPLLLAPGEGFGTGETTTVPPLAPADAEVSAALGGLEAAQYYEAYYITAAVAFQLLGEAYVVPPETSAALNLAGNQLLSLAHFLGALGSRDQRIAAETTYELLVNRTRTASPAPGPAPFPPMTDLLMPDFIYGTWERMEGVETGTRIRYRIGRNEFRKINATRVENGDLLVQTELHPGAVTANVTYRIPAGQSLDDAQANGLVKVALQVDQLGAGPITLRFTFYNRSGALPHGEVLTDEEGENAYLKLPS